MTVVVAQSVLIESGLAPNDFLLDNNGKLTATGADEYSAPWNLPSRLFQFPIEVSRADADGYRAIGLMHPALAGHPFVQRVSAIVGCDVTPGGAPNENGYTDTAAAAWLHAGDLIRAGFWRELLQTRQFTTDEAIAGGVALGLRCKGISTAHARIVMAAIGSSAPRDPVALLCATMAKPSAVTSEEKTTSWPLNEQYRRPVETPAEDKAWVFILGLEAGWFAHDRSGHIGWTEAGRDRFAAGPGGVVTESKTGQIVFDF